MGGIGGKKSLARYVEKAMDFPGGTLSRASLCELEGDRRIVVAGCRGIQSYAEDCICLRVPEGRLAIYGGDLEMNCLTTDGVTVTGRLQRIEFLP